MKRSEINSVMRKALALFEEYKVALPPFVLWTPEEWKTKGEECREIVDNMLGWDITDFGGGDFSKMGLFLITTRNGNQKQPDKYPKPYAEKLMIVEENQVTPMHFHWFKTEDIINRGGGNVLIRVYNSLPNEFVHFLHDINHEYVLLFLQRNHVLAFHETYSFHKLSLQHLHFHI